MLLRRVVSSILGILLVALSVSLFTFSNFGTDPFSSLIIGVNKSCHISYSLTYIIINCIIFIIILTLDKHQFGIMTVVTIFVSGPVTDGINVVLETVFGVPPLILRILFLMLGIVIMCLGSAFYYRADLGVSGYDACARTWSKKSRMQFRYCRIAMDSMCVFIGFILGATIGVGTLVTAFFMGPLIVYFSEKIVSKWLP